MAYIYHVTDRSSWEAAKQGGNYTAPSLETEGFIHNSDEGQVAGVLQRYYKGKKDLVLLTIDTERLTSPLKYEMAPSLNEQFPHIFGPINTDAVVDVQSINAPE